MTKRRFRLPRLLLAIAMCASTAARAESAFVLAYPSAFGPVPAATYDNKGRRIGEAKLVIEEREDGTVRMFSLAGKADGARTVASAIFEPVAPERTLRLVSQESHSFDPEGRNLGILRIDHAKRVASCTGAGESEPVEELQLPASDRVVNVPMNLFFLPLVRGESPSLKFQLFLCRDGARLVDFEAWVANGDAESPRLVEVRYAPDFGSVVSILARGFVPRLSFWFQPAAPHRWMGHRLPLYSGGPEALVLRDGVPESWVAD